MNRPLSPHLSIYKLPLTPITSIAHRISGFGVYLGILLLCWLIILSIHGSADYIWNLLNYKLVKVILFLWTQALFYHFCNGIRHLVWDIGYGYDVKVANKSAKIVILVAILINIIFWLFI